MILADKIALLWKEAERKRLGRPNRQRAIGGGRKYYLKSMEDKMLLVFVFCFFIASILISPLS